MSRLTEAELFGNSIQAKYIRTLLTIKTIVVHDQIRSYTEANEKEYQRNINFKELNN